MGFPLPFNPVTAISQNKSECSDANQQRTGCNQSKSTHLLQLPLSIVELWGVVNNAGVCFVGTPEIMAQQDVEKVMSVNFYGTVNVTKKFLPLIRRSKGRIVNVGSMNSKHLYYHNLHLFLLVLAPHTAFSRLYSRLQYLWDYK